MQCLTWGIWLLYRQGRTPVDEALGRPFQDSILAAINTYGKTVDRMDENDDPEEGVDIVDQVPGDDLDPALRPYDKYGSRT